jgi:hypothetical protein
MERYISYLAARVDGLGGNSNSIQPSPNGVPRRQLLEPAKHEYTGKVREIVFGCFGDFEGLVLATCDSTHTFKTRECGVAEIVMRACRERLSLTVCVESGHTDRICGLAIRCC